MWPNSDVWAHCGLQTLGLTCLFSKITWYCNQEDHSQTFHQGKQLFIEKGAFVGMYSNFKTSNYQEQVTSLVDILSTQLQVH